MRRRPLLTLLTLLALGGTSLAAQPIIGENDNGSPNCLPFGCAGSLSVTRVQHQYAASAFTGPLEISRFSFFCTNSFCDPTSAFGTQAFTVRLATSTRAMGSLTSDLDANVGADAVTFVSSGVATGTYGTGFTITGPGFAYDPSAGNLLLDVFIGSGFDGVGLQFLNAGFSSDVDRISQFNGGTSSNPGYGLQIGINIDTGNYPFANTVPEPGSLFLFSIGAAMLALRRRRVRL